MSQTGCYYLKLVFLVFCVKLRSVMTGDNMLLVGKSVLPIPGGLSHAVIQSVITGEFVALEHCQEAFKWDRWNCPKLSFSRHSRQPPNRETAFTKAIIAAGIVHTITRNCSRGEIKDCGCDPNLDEPLSLPLDLSTNQHYSENVQRYSGNVPNRINANLYNNGINRTDWTWGGCSDDFRFAMKVANEISSGSYRELDATAYVGRHNFKVGKEIVQQTMIKRCRCHGVSGSCSLQTCWLQVAHFKTIARKLREKYNRATRVTLATVEGSIALDNSVKQDLRKREIPVPENSLMYLEQSPDYCTANETEGWSGTKGRTCSRTKSDLATISERKSCRKLCRQCGHRVRRQKRTITKRCNCNFVWCCSVKCDTCVETVEEFYCD